MSFRKEKKIKLSKFELFELKASLLKRGMVQLFPQRTINSIYFDNRSLRMFSDSEEGVMPRKKIRLRSYNYSDKASLETKISSIEGRFKKVINTNLNIKNSVNNSVDLIDNQYGKLIPTLRVLYRREYYEYKGIRVTFDTEISYRNPTLNSLKTFYDPEVVAELKFPISFGDDYVDSLVNIPWSRFSKYCRGINIYLNHNNSIKQN